ncbi:carbohydrate kinase family protein [Bacillus infantis]|uniref:carbohydrate kinase family protein n=1 Tax=Bacillus infantis TaxID=324767 RepID=UPI003CEFBB03
MKTTDCLFVGAAAYDTIFLVEEVPLSDQRIKAKDFIQSGGGPAATAAVALQSLGMSTSLATAVGDDIFGKLIYQELKDYGVDLTAAQILPGKASAVASISVETTGKRTITYFGGCLNDFKMEDFDNNLLKGIKCIHLDGNNFELAYAMAKSCSGFKDIVVSLDGGNMRREDVMEILPFIDIFIPDDKSTKKIANSSKDLEEACRLFHSLGPSIVCITRGEKGCLCFDGKDSFSIPAYPSEIIDTTGAGDNFHGAFLYGYLKGWELRKVVHFASAFASLTCSGLGGRGNIPTEEQVKELLDLTLNH